MKQMATANTAQAAKFKEGHDALVKEWGAAHGERVKGAAAAAEKLGLSGDAVKAILEGKAPVEQVKLMYSVAKAIGADPKEFNRQQDGGATKMTPAEAQTAINEMMTNRDHAYWNGANPGHKAAVARMVELQGFADPQATKEFPVASFGS
jgi:hypothetical protein